MRCRLCPTRGAPRWSRHRGRLRCARRGQKPTKKGPICWRQAHLGRANLALDTSFAQPYRQVLNLFGKEREPSRGELELPGGEGRDEDAVVDAVLQVLEECVIFFGVELDAAAAVAGEL